MKNNGNIDESKLVHVPEERLWVHNHLNKSEKQIREERLKRKPEVALSEETEEIIIKNN